MELKPCPFCGSRGFLIVLHFASLSDTYGVECTGCHCKTYQFFKDEHEAEMAWNRRADDGTQTD